VYRKKGKVRSIEDVMFMAFNPERFAETCEKSYGRESKP
jgi:hypothetical protein